MTVKYTSSRPDETKDALQTLDESWADPMHEPDAVLVVGRVSRHAIAKKAGGDFQVTVAFEHVEIVDGEDAAAVRTLLSERHQQRTGETALDLPEVSE